MSSVDVATEERLDGSPVVNSGDAGVELMWTVSDRELYRTLFDEAPIAYHELDAAGIIRRVNHAHCELLGYGAAEMLGQPVWMFAASEEQDLGRKAIARKLKGEEPLAPCQRHYLNKNQDVLTVEVHSKLILNEHGKAVGLRTALVDLTARVAAEKAVLDSKKWLSTTLNALSVGMVAIDPLGEIMSLNRSAERLLGWTAEDAIQRDVSEVLAVESALVDGQPHTLRAILDQALLEPQTAFLQLRTSGSHPAGMDLKSVPILTEDDRIAGSVLILRPS